MTHEKWMLLAIEQAKLAEESGEVPIGAIIIQNDQLIATGFNRTIQNNDPSAHAEICCIRNAGQKMGNHRLLNTTLYITLEPCIMCYGAIIQARITHVVFGASDPKNGIISQNKLAEFSFNHQPKVVANICQDICKRQLKTFFNQRR
ncbi:tRNA adenosine(34) deaminase TadA [Candidatus Synchoanobacter obligatus]|uniref:tRNA-specific adenosine deaminase n=1 Tax=Candidatus Synchoanobacter obligatus TaxID=2919597 RepID=A0ABT1L6Z0_9GAMM|nr:tRNA adenosine(34) deaminase TadA [Candidatus Synchoanobacter obligatus]MCP8352440.1 tRNA adenosine(34) deaminase TadA [Candidatus Synchoanobacter obligatus]